MIRDDILCAVGRTPLVRLRRIIPDAGFELFAKLESLNPGGSLKDRPARDIIESGIHSGHIRPGTVIVESSSGNMGIGLAQACRYYGLRFICVVDCKTTQQNVQVLRAYGAEVEVVDEPDPETSELLQARLRRVQEIRAGLQESFWPNQYANLANSQSHYRYTMREIVEALDGRVDYVFTATSTCGTLRGCGDYIRDHAMLTRLVAVDAKGSRIFGDEPADRKVPGLGAGFEPPLCNPSSVYRCLHVTTLECVVGCRLLMAREAILAGGSSGGVAAAIARLAAEIPAGATCVAVFPDRGERYLDTIYSDRWVHDNFGDVAHLWADQAPAGTLLRPLRAQERAIEAWPVEMTIGDGPG